MKKIFTIKTAAIILAIVSMAFCFTACGTSNKAVQNANTNTEVDIAKVAQEFLDAKVFDDLNNFAKVDDKIAKKRLSLEDADVSQMVYHAGTKAVVDEVIIVKSPNADSAKKVKAAFDKHLKSQKDGYSSYGPDQVPKLDKAICKTSGNYAILVVAKDDAKAQEIVKKYFN